MTDSVTERFFLELLDGLTRGKGIAFVARSLAERVQRPVLITNTLDRVLVFHDPLSTDLSVGEHGAVLRSEGEPPPEDLFAAGADAVRTARVSVGDQLLPCLCVALYAAGRIWGHCLVVAAEGELGSGEKRLVWQAALAAMLALRVAMQRQEEQERYQDDLIRDMLYNNYDSKQGILEKAEDWNWDLTGPLVVAVVSAPGDQLPRVRDLGMKLFHGRCPIYARLNDQLVTILSCHGMERRKAKEALQRQLEEYTERMRTYRIAGARIGIGSQVADVTDLYRSYQEAKVALEMGKAFSRGEICHFEEMGVFQFIFTQPASALQEFCDRVLGPIAAYDAEMGTDLQATLETYIDSHCQIPKCARALFVHENTLRNRLKKIEDLTGHDIHRVDHVVSFFIALQILRLGQGA